MESGNPTDDDLRQNIRKVPEQQSLQNFSFQQKIKRVPSVF